MSERANRWLHSPIRAAMIYLGEENGRWTAAVVRDYASVSESALRRELGRLMREKAIVVSDRMGRALSGRVTGDLHDVLISKGDGWQRWSSRPVRSRAGGNRRDYRRRHAIENLLPQRKGETHIAHRAQCELIRRLCDYHGKTAEQLAEPCPTITHRVLFGVATGGCLSRECLEELLETWPIKPL